MTTAYYRHERLCLFVTCHWAFLHLNLQLMSPNFMPFFLNHFVPVYHVLHENVVHCALDEIVVGQLSLVWVLHPRCFLESCMDLPVWPYWVHSLYDLSEFFKAYQAVVVTIVDLEYLTVVLVGFVHEPQSHFHSEVQELSSCDFEVVPLSENLFHSFYLQLKAAWLLLWLIGQSTEVFPEEVFAFNDVENYEGFLLS